MPNLSDLLQLSPEYFNTGHDGIWINGMESHAEIVIRGRAIKKMTRPRLNQYPRMGRAPGELLSADMFWRTQPERVGMFAATERFAFGQKGLQRVM